MSVVRIDLSEKLKIDQMPEAEGSEGEALKILARRIIQAEGNVARTE